MVTSENDISPANPQPAWPDKFNEFRVCVIIPTYNNAPTLGKTITAVAFFTRNIIVVNDGSVDQTAEIAGSFPFVKTINYSVNTGKGWALRKGFRFALDLGYQYAITIDSDGQHFADDLPKFMNRLESGPPAIIIGARNMDQDSVPGKSSFGHKFSNFWFLVETGIRAPDTQSGYRLYPIGLLRQFRFFTKKYEFEIEVLVRAAWKGIPIESVPVKVYYPPKSERISHFRPFQDFTRISILNTILVLISFLYIKPRDFFSRLFQKKNWQGFLNDQLLALGQSDALKSVSVGFGVFMGILPIWGFQLALAIFLAFVFRLNKALVIIAANISLPPMIPVIIFASYKMGALWMHEPGGNIHFSKQFSLETIRYNLQQYIYGSISLAILAGVLCSLTSFALLKMFRKKLPTAVQNQ